MSFEPVSLTVVMMNGEATTGLLLLPTSCVNWNAPSPPTVFLTIVILPRTSIGRLNGVQLHFDLVSGSVPSRKPCALLIVFPAPPWWMFGHAPRAVVWSEFSQP